MTRTLLGAGERRLALVRRTPGQGVIWAANVESVRSIAAWSADRMSTQSQTLNQNYRHGSFLTFLYNFPIHRPEALLVTTNKLGEPLVANRNGL